MKLILLLIVMGILAISKCSVGNTLCELSRNQKIVLLECLESYLTEEQKASEYQFYQCLGYDSVIDYYEEICGLSEKEQEELHLSYIKCHNEMTPYSGSATDEDARNCLNNAIESEQ
uniref:Putative ribonuclease R n=1 Tax=Mesobuthus gibbosus TaxID=123226 RepID=A0A059UED9_MESGB|nr:putative ribonuclease R [Mesobuthus gibbosus]